MNRAIKFFGAFAIIGLFFLTACATTELTKVWKDNAYTGGPIESVMVVGVSKKAENRKMFEQFFRQQFEANGIKSVASGSVIPGDNDPDKDKIKGAAQQQGMQTVLVTHLVRLEEEETDHPASFTTVQEPDLVFGAYYGEAHRYEYRPGYTEQNTKVQLESNLYETKTEKLIWKAISESINSGSVNKVIEELCKKVMKSLRENKLIK
jgi:hypothetical protein